MSEFDFNDPQCFPKEQNLSGINMLKDGSLRVSTHTGPPQCTTVVFICPKDSKMFEWLLSITGPLAPGGSHLFLESLEFGTD